MGWLQVKPKVIQALRDGTFQHESRRNIATKNLLQMGEVTADEIAQVLRTARGTNHRTAPHHSEPEIDVNIVTHKGWYIKFHFADPDTIFISVHK